MRPIPLIIAGVCALALVGLYLGFSFIPDQHRIGDDRHIERAVKLEVNRLEKVSAGLPRIQQELERIDAEWATAAGFLLPQDSVPNFISWFRNAPQRNGLESGLDFGPIDSRDCYKVLPFRLRVTGSSMEFRRLLAVWKQQPKGWGIAQMTVFWEDSGIIRATITGALYLQRLD